MQRMIGIFLVAVLVPSVALADDTHYTREETRKDGSVWRFTIDLHKDRVHFKRERTKSPDGRYSMAADKSDDWDLTDAKALAKALTDLDHVPAAKAANVTAKEWIEACVEVKTKRCSRHAAADKGTPEDAALDKVRWELMNHTELDSI